MSIQPSPYRGRAAVHGGDLHFGGAPPGSRALSGVGGTPIPVFPRSGASLLTARRCKMSEVRFLALPSSHSPFWHLKAGAACYVDYAKQRVTLQDTRVLTMDRLEELAMADLSNFGHICPLDGGPPMVPESW